jgi:hypothetical protein
VQTVREKFLCKACEAISRTAPNIAKCPAVTTEPSGPACSSVRVAARPHHIGTIRLF